MARSIGRGIAVFAASVCVCAALLLAVCAWIPQSSIAPAMQRAEAYFSANGGFPMVVEGAAATRMDNYADVALLSVIYHADHTQPLRSVISSPYYRNDGQDIRLDFHASVVDGQPANNEYSRYWHGSQVLLRPLLTFASIEGCRAILFGLLLAMNAVLAWLLVRRRALRPLIIYLAGMVLVQFWMCLFTLEYVMSFLVMTGACIAVALLVKPGAAPAQNTCRMTHICIASGVAVCFLDFLTAETLTFTVPVLLFLMLNQESSQKPLHWKQLFGWLVRFGAAWVLSYAMMFLIKWALVYAVMGAEALMNVFSSAAYRIDRSAAADPAAGETVRSALLPAMLARNIGILFPFATRLTVSSAFGAAAGVLAVWGAVWYLFRAPKTDGVFLTGLLLVGLIPYARMLALSSHALDHYFFTYRAQAATLMALLAVLVYSIRPSDLRKGQKRRQRTKKMALKRK